VLACFHDHVAKARTPTEMSAMATVQYRTEQLSFNPSVAQVNTWHAGHKFSQLLNVSASTCDPSCALIGFLGLLQRAHGEAQRLAHRRLCSSLAEHLTIEITWCR